jgi:transcriptional regulator with XRE-family HTH domain
MSHSPPKPWLTLRQRRIAAGLTPAQLAAESGLSTSYVEHLEAGRRRGTPDTVAKLAKALGVKSADLRPELGLNPDAPTVLAGLAAELGAINERIESLQRLHKSEQGAA